MESETRRLQTSITGCLIGTAVGDALGLPAEGIDKNRQRRLYPILDGHRFLFGRGMCSDDTDHACMVAQSLVISAGDADEFTRRLASHLRMWLLSAPAGVGLATLKSTLRLLAGVPPDRSGVFSAGNGPAMRSPLIGVSFGHDVESMRRLVRASTRITHTDRKAEYGSLAVAQAAFMSSQSGEAVAPDEYCQAVRALLPDDGEDLMSLITRAADSASSGRSIESFAEEIGCSRGVSGYIYSTVPMVLHAWFSHPDDYRSAIIELIRCGGDTDTSAAILGGIIGARVGPKGIPEDWLNGLLAWPMGIGWMEQLGTRLSQVVSDLTPQERLPVPFPYVALRNALFLSVVLLHGFRRLMPPY